MTKAEQLMRKARFSKRYQGYHYLLQCIELVLDDDSRLCALSKQVYQPIAQKYYEAPSVGELIEILALYLKEEEGREHTA